MASSQASLRLPKNSILQQVIEVSIPSTRSVLYEGPSNPILYDILQGFLTVLIMKELISLTRYFVKRSKSLLDVNRIILWNMVEDWDDLYKVVVRRILNPRPLYLLDSPFRKKRAKLDSLGWRRMLCSLAIALFLLVADVSLIFSQLPDNRVQDARFMKKLTWNNTAPVVQVTTENVVIGSYSRIIRLSSHRDENEFIRLPSISLDRTDFRDFEQPLPVYNTDLLKCSVEERWRVLCKVHCENRYYQYKLRLDANTNDSKSFFFVPTSNFSFSEDIVENYAREIYRQFRIRVSNNSINATGTDFVIRAKNQPKEFVQVPISANDTARRDVLTNDAIATIFLSSIHVGVAPENTSYYERNATQREVNESILSGTIAVSNTPYVTLLGTLIIYVVLQAISIFLQFRIRMHVSAPEISILLEAAGISTVENFSNADVTPMDPVYSATTTVESNERVGHIGFLPAVLVAEIRNRYNDWKHDNDDDGVNRYNIIKNVEEFESLKKFGGADRWRSLKED